MAIFDVAAKGRKECPTCHKFSAARASTCEGCNHVFYERKAPKAYVSKGGKRGRKVCPACNASIGVRCGVCPECQHVFVPGARPAVPQGPLFAERAGPGRKECPACHKFVGVRNRACPVCQAVFPANPKKPLPPEVAAILQEAHKQAEDKKLEVNREASKLQGYEVIFIPSGRCPQPLRTLTETNVKRWVRMIQKAYVKKKTFLRAEGFRYYAREFFDINEQKEEYNQACALINAVCALEPQDPALVMQADTAAITE